MKLLRSLAAAAIMLAGATTVNAQTGDEIIQKHIDAIGGNAWNNVHTLKLNGALSVQGMEIGMSQTVQDNKGMRMDMTIMGNNCYTIITPTEGWMYMPMQPGLDKVTPMSAEDLKGSQYKLNVRGVQIADKAIIEKAEYLGKDSVNGAACYKVKVTEKGGGRKTAYFDTKTYFLVRSEDVIKMHEQEQELSVDFSDFKKLPEGITLAMVWGTPQGDVTIKSVEVNKDYGPDVFKPTEPKK